MLKHTKILFWALLLLTSCTQKIKLVDTTTNEIITPKALKIIDNLDKEDYSSAYNMFTFGLQKKISQEKLQSMWKDSVLPKAGNLKRVVSYSSSVVSNSNEVRVVTEHEKYDVITKILFNNENNTSGIYFNFGEKKYVYDDSINPPHFTEKKVVLGEETSTPLNAVITIPNEANNNLPGVILLSDIGSYDKDETTLSNKFLKDLAEKLANENIASIRFDKPNYTYSVNLQGSALLNFTVNEEYVQPALQAKKALMEVSNVDKNNIFIVGHGLGGSVSLRVMESSDDIKGAVFMASSPRPLWEIYNNNLIDYANTLNLKSDNKDKMIQQINQQYLLGQSLIELSREESTQIMAFNLTGLYMKDLYENSQIDALEKFTKDGKHFLILQGDLDRKIYKGKDFLEYEKIGNNMESITLKSFPNLNHLFSIGDNSKSIEDEMKTQMEIDSNVIAVIKDFLYENMNP